MCCGLDLWVVASLVIGAVVLYLVNALRPDKPTSKGVPPPPDKASDKAVAPGQGPRAAAARSATHVPRVPVADTRKETEPEPGTAPHAARKQPAPAPAPVEPEPTPVVEPEPAEAEQKPAEPEDEQRRPEAPQPAGEQERAEDDGWLKVDLDEDDEDNDNDNEEDDDDEEEEEEDDDEKEDEVQKPRVPKGLPKLNLALPALDRIGSMPHPPSPSPPEGKDDEPAQPQTKKFVVPKLTVSLAQVREEFGGKSEDCLQRQRRLDEATGACHEIRPGLFLAADPVARDHALLQSHGITHVLNTASVACANYHEHHASQPLQYLALSLADGAGQDLLCCVYPALAFMDGALGDGGRVLVHCWQGVSRSSSMVIAWLMANEGLGFDAALAVVKEKRSVARPNAGFMCQLLEWGQRLQRNFKRTMVYKVATLADSKPAMLVALRQHKPTRDCLGDGTCVVVHATNGQLFLWVGKDAPADNRQCAEVHCNNLRRYEHAADTTVVLQGEETEAFWLALDGPHQ